MHSVFRTLLPLLALSPLLACAQSFVGTEDFNTLSTAKWAFPFHTPSDTTNNGLLTFTGTKLEFTKATDGHGDHFYRWDGTPGVAGNYSSASYTTSWQMDVSATNLVEAAGAGKFAAIGIIARAGVASPVADSYTGIMLENFNGSLTVLGETNDFLDQIYDPVALNTDVRLRLAWDALAQTLTGSYSVNGGATYLQLMTVDILSGPDTWSVTPVNGFAFDVFGYSNVTGAIAAGQMSLDGFSLAAIPEPSTYAALVGLGALGLALWRRRQVKVAV